MTLIFHQIAITLLIRQFFEFKIIKTGQLQLQVSAFQIYISTYILYSVRGLERSELGGSHGCPGRGRLWDRFLWQVYTPSKASRPGQPWDPPNSLRSKPRTEYTTILQWLPNLIHIVMSLMGCMVMQWPPPQLNNFKKILQSFYHRVFS